MIFFESKQVCVYIFGIYIEKLDLGMLVFMVALGELYFVKRCLCISRSNVLLGLILLYLWTPSFWGALIKLLVNSCWCA